MNGDIKLTAPGGLPGDIWLGGEDPATSTFTLSGRVVGVTGVARTGVLVTVFERRSLTVDVRLASATTDGRGYYRAVFTLPGSRLLGDVFVRAEDSSNSDVADSALFNDVSAGAYTIDLVLGEGEFQGMSEWELIADKIEPLLGSTLPESIPPDRLEWLAKRADVFPLHLAAYIQAHRLAFDRSVKAQTCYAFLRGGLPADMPGLLAAGASAWETALRSSWTGAILPLPDDGSAVAQDLEVANELAAMRELLVDAALVMPAAGVNRRVILDTASISENDQRTFTQLWVNHEGTLEEFWTGVEGSGLAAQAQLLKFTFHAAAVIGNHVPTLQALQAKRALAEISTLSETAAWSRDTWDTFLDDASVTPPEDVSGADAAEKRQRYARALYNIIEDQHRSLSLRHAIARDISTGAPDHTDHLIAFLDANPEFDIDENNINVYLAGAASPWTGIDPADQGQARANLDLVQRVYRLSPRIGRYETTKVLLNNGITSASSVVSRTREEFIDEFGPLFSDDDHHADGLAAAVWDNAAEVVSTAMALVSTYKFSDSKANWLPVANFGNDAFEGDTNGLDGLSQILGNLDFCACEHCRSVFSPAAYLADLLKFLDDRKLLDDLNGRRPDIQHILLDCHNTNTVLPYIDLVNELLEIYLASSHSLPASSKQTTWTAEELRLHPEHLEASVYESTLPGMVHPWTQPFSLPTREARLYLDKLGAPRQQLLRACLPVAPSPAEQNALAAEVLGLSEVEFSIVAGTYTVPSADKREFWGFEAGAADADWYKILRGDLDPELETDIGELLRRAKLTLEELRKLVELEFINPDGDVVLQWAETCALADASIAFFDIDNFDRLHRFVRLQRACGIPARMLNVLIQDNLGGALTETTLRTLADIVSVKTRLRIDWDVVATFWSDKIDARAYTSGRKSLYHRRFLEADPIGDTDALALVADTTDLVGEGDGPITAAELPRLLAGLGIRRDDYDVLRTVRPGHVPPLPDDPLEDPTVTFANITALFRWANFARAIRWSIPDLVLFANSEDPAADPSLSTEDLFSSPSQTLKVLDLIDGVRSTGVSLAEFDWLLRHEFKRDPLSPDAVVRTLAELGRGLLRIEAEAAQFSSQPQATEVTSEPAGPLAAHLAKVLVADLYATVPEKVERHLQIVRLNSNSTPTEQEAFIEVDFGHLLDTDEAKSILVPPVPLPDVPDLLHVDTDARTGWLLGKLIGHLRRKALVIESVASAFDISAEVADELLNRNLLVPGVVPEKPLFEAYRIPFATDAELSPDGTFDATTDPPQFLGWTRLAKAASICRTFGMKTSDVRWFWRTVAPWLKPNELPLSSDDDRASFAAWERLRIALGLRRLSRPDENVLEQLEQASDIGAAVEILASHTGWDSTGISAVADHLGYTTPAPFQEEVAPARIGAIADIAKRSGVGMTDILAWSSSPTVQQGSAVKLAVRNKFGESRWPEVATPIRDDLRERQRDALVDAVIASDADLFRTTNDVFEYFLIDVEMGHCMMTSRIKQAITSVQVFIHRIFLRLEDGAQLTKSEAKKRWAWMKNYRVWEANRKVFLYPENWIEPELRLDKTPEFAELEADLIQGDLTDHAAGNAIEKYLRKIDRVSGLEIISIDAVDDPLQENVTWILGRTPSEPYEWFVRQKSSAGWGVWEDVPAAVEGSAVALKVVRGRLIVFWATSAPKAHWLRKYDKDSGRPTDASVEGEVFQISHCERSGDGTWGKVSVSRPSDVAVKVGRGLRLLIVEHRGGEEVELVLLSDWYIRPSYVTYAGYEQPNRVMLRAGFVYFPAERKVWFGWLEPLQLGDLVESAEVYLSNDDYQLLLGGAEQYGAFQLYYMSSHLLLRRPGYRIDGQRFEFTGEFVDSVDIVMPETDFPGTASLLCKPSRGVGHALVHQADSWLESKMVKAHPVVYDDWKRKYLVTKVRPDAAPRRADVPKLGGLTLVGDFHACWGVPPSMTVFLPNLRPTVRPQAVRQVRSFSSGVPSGPQLSLRGDLDFGGLVQSQIKETLGGSMGVAAQTEVTLDGPLELNVESLYHPHVDFALQVLARDGVVGLFSGSRLFRQLKSDDPNPEMVSKVKLPLEEFDFAYGSAYGTYNWELFFHVPLLVAQRLAGEQRWDEAQQWYHFIFDPIDVVEGEVGPGRFWRIKPFVQQAAGLAKNDFEAMAGIGVTDAERKRRVKAFNQQVAAWESSPFDPHAVARIRPGVYQRVVLRKYFDNLISWADSLFRRDTIESISEATVLYVLVAQLLGPRPQEVPAPVEGGAQSFWGLSQLGLDSFANALEQVESYVYVPTKRVEKKGCGPDTGGRGWASIPMLSRFWYFCYPPNPQLLAYWDVLEDRLFKIRNCLNIEGQERALALFEPPIDPALLVAATAAGVDLQSVLAALDSSLPPYRFRSVHARASALVGTLKALGGSLLSALEKRDAEELARLRSGHEVAALARARDVRVSQVEEGRRNIQSLEAARAVTEHRRTHYQGLINGKLSDKEKRQFELASKAALGRRIAGGSQQLAGLLALVPQVTIGLTPGAEFGGINISSGLNAVAGVASLVAAEHDYHGNKAGQKAGYERREEDWRLQMEQAEKEIARVNRDLLAAQVRLRIAERELDNHDAQVAESRDVDRFMRNKYTNTDLYNWMKNELAGVYFQTYQLAFDLAKRAERAYRHELAIDDGAPIIKYGYWDSLKSGLLAGERLGHDLERLDLAYMDRDRRELELRKSVSLSALNPGALVDLQEDGECDIEIPEELFDLDHPGHYLRRIKAVRVTIPAVVGPYTSLSARLRLNSHKTRFNPDVSGDYVEGPEGSDERFKYGTGAGKAISTSSAVQDGGLFNLDFRDERYLPFEYDGVIGSWTLTLPGAVRQFDYRTISDVVIHIDYTARDGGKQLRDGAEGNLAAKLAEAVDGMALAQSFVVQDAFPNEWEQFFTEPSGGAKHVLNLPIGPEMFPHFTVRGSVAVNKYEVILVLSAGIVGENLPITPSFAGAISLIADGTLLVRAEIAASGSPPAAWSIEVDPADVTGDLATLGGHLDRAAVQGMVVIAHYTVSFPTP